MKQEAFERLIAGQLGIDGMVGSFPPVRLTIGNLQIAATRTRSLRTPTWRTVTLIANTNPDDARSFRIEGKLEKPPLPVFHGAAFNPPERMEIDIDPRVLRMLADAATLAMFSESAAGPPASGQDEQPGSAGPTLVINGVPFVGSSAVETTPQTD